MPPGTGLILLDADGAQVPFRTLSTFSPLCAAIRESAAAVELGQEPGQGPGKEPSERQLRVYLVPASESFTVPLELHADGFAPGTRGARLRVDDAATVPSSSSTVHEPRRIAIK